MSWTIQDLNEHEIYITNGWLDYTLPKFAISFEISGDYLNLYWYNGQAGSGRYTLGMDYQDVDCGAYTDIPDCPVSAADLQAMIEELIVSAWDGITPGGGGHSVAEFIDLLTTPNLESQWVEAFDSNTKQGGGYFQFINESNAAIALIAGYQIKTSLSATGYWRRVDPLNQFNAAWCGALNEVAPGALDTYGWTQTDANVMWGVGLVDVTVDTYDLAALRYCMSLLDVYDSVSINLEPKDFYINDTVWIPKYFEFLRVYGNFAWIHSTNADAYDLIGRPEATDLADAQVMLNCRYYFECLNINAQGSQTGLKPGPSTSAAFWMVDTYNGGQGIELEFCLNFYFLECVNKLSTNGFLVRNDDCSDCDENNSNSNMSSMVHCRAYNEDGAGGKAFAFYGVSGGQMQTCTVEGHFYDNPIYIDGQDAGTIKGFNVLNCHYECVDTATDETTQAFVYVRQAGGVVNVKGAIGHYPMVMVNSGGTTGTLHVSIEDVVGWSPLVDGADNWWFYNGGNSTYDLINIPDLGGDPSIIAALIAGTPMFDWWTAGPGNNRFRLLATPLNAVVPASSAPTVAQVFDIEANELGTYGFISSAEFLSVNANIIDNDFYGFGGGAGITLNATGITPSLNHPGILRAFTGTTAAGYIGVQTGPAVLRLVIGGGVFMYESIVMIPTLPTVADNAVVFVRLTNAFNVVNPTQEIAIFLDITGGKTSSSASPNWQYMTTNGSKTPGVSGVAVNAGQWYRLKFVVDAAATSVEFFVDGTSIGTSGAFIPSGTGTPLMAQTSIHKTNYTATGRSLDIDYCKIAQAFTTPR